MEKKIIISDSNVTSILSALNAAGYEAYIVGGAVRDALLGLEPHDYDITTSATPSQVSEVIKNNGWQQTVKGQSADFGIILAVMPDGQDYEIATFRGESYSDQDSHRPDSVWYSNHVEEDVLRRDFTINALCSDRTGRVHDFVGGAEDLANCRLNTVGNAEVRFHEDALRVFRACRFIGKLGFLAAPEMVSAIPLSFDRVKGLSLVRVRTELEKLLVSDHASNGLDLMVKSGLAACRCCRKENGKVIPVPILPELGHLVGCPQSLPHTEDCWEHTLNVLSNTPKDLTLRWAALLHDVAKGMEGVRGQKNGKFTDYGHAKKGAVIAEEILSRLGYNSQFVKKVVWLVEVHMDFHQSPNPAKWVRKQAATGLFKNNRELIEAIHQLLVLSVADCRGTGEGQDPTHDEEIGAAMIEAATNFPVSSKDLHIDSRVPAAAGKFTGDCIRSLLQRVQAGTLANDSDALAEAARKWAEKRGGGNK